MQPAPSSSMSGIASSLKKNRKIPAQQLSGSRISGGLLGLVIFSFPIVVILAIFLGTVDLETAETLFALFGEGSQRTDTIIAFQRLPRVIVGLLVGVHFALSGALLQAITRNPLADPTILGVSQGATLAVMLFLMFAVYAGNSDGSQLFTIPLEYLPLAGCLGGLIAGFAVYLLSWQSGLSPLRLTLMGIALGAVLHALAMGLLAGWGSTRMESILLWMSGSLYARGWDHLIYLLPWTVASLFFLPLLRRPVRLLQLEDDCATSFGLSVPLWRSLALAVGAGLAASAVGVVGPVGFIGLVVPHLARYLSRGTNQHFYIPIVALLGAGLVVGSDLIGRLLLSPNEVPVGIIAALLGVPVFLVLLRRYG
ncbi:iron ABC transporter permease [Kiloniella laminariae]|uniref:Iron ABC transporter permease n=1 Tax=Kiloniella laminariae TaxID=454162 RepID=A0ABT4LEL6_9PROT|nr:iron ABC transporter permease [Kiloniella laminariae]MCZ4279539.1 iron ABC transporter permease [Kiloniella laminariae]